MNLRSRASVKFTLPENRTRKRRRKRWFQKILFLEQIVQSSRQKKAFAQQCVQQTVEISY